MTREALASIALVLASVAAALYVTWFGTRGTTAPGQECDRCGRRPLFLRRLRHPEYARVCTACKRRIRVIERELDAAMDRARKVMGR